MSSRKAEKERRRREREEAERALALAQRRRQRLQLVAVAMVALVVTAVTVAVLIGRPDEEDASAAFEAKPDGARERVQEAGLALAGDHFHPVVKVFVAGEEVPVPDDIGATSDGGHLPVHRHPGDDKLHAEGLQEGRFSLGQFMKVWGVPFSPTRLGPHRADRQRALRVYVKQPGADRFAQTTKREELQLRDGQEVYISYGTPQQHPIAE